MESRRWIFLTGEKKRVGGMVGKSKVKDVVRGIFRENWGFLKTYQRKGSRSTWTEVILRRLWTQWNRTETQIQTDLLLDVRGSLTQQTNSDIGTPGPVFCMRNYLFYLFTYFLSSYLPIKTNRVKITKILTLLLTTVASCLQVYNRVSS